MTFFTEAMDDGTIDKRANTSQAEIATHIALMTMESNSWLRHKERHRDAQLVGFGFEERKSEFGKRSEITHEDSAVNYDKLTKHFTVGCQCGQQFEVSIGDGTVKPADPNLKMKELDPYDKNKNSYGREGDAGPVSVSYNLGPVRPNISYNSKDSRPAYDN